MKTVIMGAGAMGSLFGGLLASSGEEVYLVDHKKEHVDKIRSEGLIIEKEGRCQTIRVNATTDVTSLGKADLVLFFVKTYQTEQAVSDSLVLEKPNTIFLSLQNGLGNEEVICKKVDRQQVILGVTGQGATYLEPGHIRHAGWGETQIGELNGEITERVNLVAQMFQKAGISTRVSSKIHDHIWEKLLVNVGINALTALTGLKNGELLDFPETIRLMESLVLEAVEVAKRKGIGIEGNPIEKVKRIAELTRENRSSMGQDFDHKRRTEIDAINGAIVKEADRLAISVPFNQAITNLVKVIEKKMTSSHFKLEIR